MTKTKMITRKGKNIIAMSMKVDAAPHRKNSTLDRKRVLPLRTQRGIIAGGAKKQEREKYNYSPMKMFTRLHSWNPTVPS
jgi:hypothetical protein